MKRRLTILALVLVVGGVIMSSCKKEEVLSDKKEILSFIFEASKNAELDHNILGVISGSDVNVDVPFGTTVSNLTPTIEVSPKAVLTPQSGLATDFSSPVSYTVTAEDGSVKEFTTQITVEPAPYIGTWISNAIDFGLGLMYVHLQMDADGFFKMELRDIIGGDLHPESIQGIFDPLTRPYTETELTQTHKWASHQWTEISNSRTFMYHFDGAPLMRFYYCYCYPLQSWAFQTDLHRQ